MEILELENLTTQIRNSLDEPSSRMEMNKEGVSEPEDRSVKIIQQKERTEPVGQNQKA